MCFSAPASFTATGVLVLTAAFSIHRSIAAKDRSFFLLALIPLFFAIQQVLEGFVWLYVANRELQETVMGLSFAYLFFAYFLWPFYIPLSLLVFDRSRRVLFFCFSLIGLGFGLVAYIYLLANPDLVHARVVSNSICYLGLCGMSVDGASLLYLVLTCGALLLASWNHLKVLGALVLISCVISYAFFWITFASTWCFFSAIISIYVAYLSQRVYANSEE